MRSLGTTSADIVAVFIAEDATPSAYVAAAPLLGAARTSAINKRKGTKREKRRDPESRRNY